MDSVHISRRSFVRHGAAVAFFGPGLVVCNRAPAAAAEEVSLRVVVPTRIYFPQRRRTTLGAYGSEVTTLALTADVLAVRFADGATIDLPADVSSAEHHRDAAGEEPGRLAVRRHAAITGIACLRHCPARPRRRFRRAADEQGARQRHAAGSVGAAGRA